MTAVASVSAPFHPELLLVELLPVIRRMVGGRDAPVSGWSSEDVVQEVLVRALLRARAGYFHQPARVSRKAQALDLIKRLIRHTLDPRVRKDALRRYASGLDDAQVGVTEPAELPDIDHAWFALMPPRQQLYARLLVAPSSVSLPLLERALRSGERTPDEVKALIWNGEVDPVFDASFVEHARRVAWALHPEPDDALVEAVRRTLLKAMQLLLERESGAAGISQKRLG